MKVLEKRIKKDVNKQIKFIRDNIDYFTIEQLPIIEKAISNINKIGKSIEILASQRILDKECYLSLFDYLSVINNELFKYKYKYKYKVKDGKKL